MSVYVRLSYTCNGNSGEAIVKVAFMNDAVAEKGMAIKKLAQTLNVELDKGLTVFSAWSLGDKVIIII